MVSSMHGSEGTRNSPSRTLARLSVHSLPVNRWIWICLGYQLGGWHLWLGCLCEDRDSVKGEQPPIGRGSLRNSFTCSQNIRLAQSMDTSRAFVFAFVPTRGRTLAQTTPPHQESGPGSVPVATYRMLTACWLLRFPSPTSHVLHLLPSLQTTFPHSSSPSTDSSTEYTYTTNPAIVAWIQICTYIGFLHNFPS